MDKIKQKLIQLKESIEAIINELDTPKVEKAEITLEQVRGVLADKSRAGHTAEVKSLINKYGAERLSDIAPKDYAQILKEAEVI